MNVDIQARDFTITDGIRAAVLDACENFLHHYSDRISAISVHLADINGPRGGNDKLCRVSVKLQHGPIVVANQVSDDLYFSVKQAVAKAGRGASTRIRKQKSRFEKLRQRFRQTYDYGTA